MPSESSLSEAELDEENERVLLREADRYEVGEGTSLGEHIEEIGEEHGWGWLSEFAREHLESEGREYDLDVEADPDDTDFERAVERQVHEWHEAHDGWPDAGESDE